VRETYGDFRGLSKKWKGASP